MCTCKDQTITAADVWVALYLTAIVVELVLLIWWRWGAAA